MASQHDLQVNLPAGLRDPVMFSSKNAAIIQDLDQIQDSRNPGIHSILQPDIAHKFNTPGTAVPVLDKDTLQPPFVDPAARTPLTSKFSYALGLGEVIRSQFADRNVQDIISVNHQLRDGNFVGAEETIGRPLTDDEIARRQVTPSTLTGQYNYALNVTGNALVGSEANQIRDQFYQNELVKIEDSMQRGDTLNAGMIQLVKIYFQHRGLDKVDPALRQLYQEVMSQVFRYKGAPKSDMEPSAPPDPSVDLFQLGSRINPFRNPPEVKGDAEPLANGDAMNVVYGSGIGKVSKEHIRLGKYEFDKSKLKHGGMLSLRYATSKRKVNGYPNTKVTDTFRDHLLHLTTGKGVPIEDLSAADQNYMHRLIKQSEADIKLKPVGAGNKKGNPVEHLYVMLAEIDAGNDSQLLKSNINKLLTQLQSKGHISFSLAQDIRKEYF